MARAAGSTAPGALTNRQAVPWALVAVVGAFATVLVDPIIGLPIAGAALGGLVYGQRPLLSSIVGLVAGVLAGAALYAVALPLTGVPITVRETLEYTAVVVASLLVAGPGAAALMRTRSAVETMVVVTGALTAISVAEIAVYASEAGQSVSAYIETFMMSIATQMGLSEEMGRAVVSMWPGALVAANGLTALLVVVGIGIVGVRLGVTSRKIPPLARFDLDVRIVVLPIAAIALLAASRLSIGIAPTLEIVGNNLLMIARMVFFLQGVAAFAGLYERAKLARPVRIAGFVLLGVTEAFIPAVSLTGLADMWLNLRRLPRDGIVPGGPGATSDGN